MTTEELLESERRFGFKRLTMKEYFQYLKGEVYTLDLTTKEKKIAHVAKEWGVSEEEVAAAYAKAGFK